MNEPRCECHNCVQARENQRMAAQFGIAQFPAQYLQGAIPQTTCKFCGEIDTKPIKKDLSRSEKGNEYF